MENTNHKMAALRKKLADTGKSPTLLGQEAILNEIEWLRRFGFSTPSILQEVVKRTTGGQGKKLVDKGLAIRTPTPYKNPTCYFTLTRYGLDLANSNAEELYRYKEINPIKVNKDTFLHDMTAQTLTVNALNTGAIFDFQTERMLDRDGDKARVKKPDVVWLSKIGRFALEVELSGKWGQDLDEFILKIILALTANEAELPMYDGFIIAAVNQKLIDRYRDALMPGMSIGLWEKNYRNHWQIEKRIQVPEWLIDKVEFQLIVRSV